MYLNNEFHILKKNGGDARENTPAVAPANVLEPLEAAIELFDRDAVLPTMLCNPFVNVV